jgi:hypothetical protein
MTTLPLSPLPPPLPHPTPVATPHHGSAAWRWPLVAIPW